MHKMKAVAVHPGQPNSVHLAELTKPAIHQIPQGRGVLVKVLKVGVDATDREINDALYGNASRSASSRRWARR
jgi:threonine dehydrogenase-like Zn-dependent dehydrogenase